MAPDDREQLERDARTLASRGDTAAAAAIALRAYGPELTGFLTALLGNEAEADDSFAEVCEIVWRNLPAFGWESTLRAWAYGIARRVASTFRRNAGRRRRREARAGESALEVIVQAVRTETQSFLRTEKRTRLQTLRDELPEEDRALLILRVDRGLEWIDLARVLAETEANQPLDTAALAREAARLRKRFQIVKDRLRARAKREGTIG